MTTRARQPRGVERDITKAFKLGQKVLAELQTTEFDTTNLELLLVILEKLDARRSKRQKTTTRKART